MYSNSRIADRHVKGELTSTYLMTILYGGNASHGIGGINTVEFEYEPRTDEIPTIAYGRKGLVSYRLISVTSSTGHAVYRKYSIDYVKGSELSEIASIKVSGAHGEYLPTTSFTWDDSQDVTTKDISFPDWCSKPVDGQYFMADDVTGDGRTNLLAVSNESGDRHHPHIGEQLFARNICI